MEEETYDVNKRYNSSSLSFWHNLYAVAVVAVVAISYVWLPAVVDSLKWFIDWFNWVCHVLSYLSISFVVVTVLSLLIYFFFWKITGESKPKSYHQYPAASSPEPPVVRALSCDYTGLGESEDYGNYDNKSRYKEINVPAFQAVREAGESSCSYERVVAEVSSKSYRRTRSEKKMEKARTKVEYRRMESERTTMSQTINGLSIEEVRMTVESFMAKKNGVVDQWQNVAAPQWQNGAVDQWQNYVPQLQNGAVDQWQNYVPQLQNGAVDKWQWQNYVPQLQNGAVDQWQQNCAPQWQNGAVDQWQQNCAPQWQNGAVDQWQQNCAPQWQNGVVDQWQTCFPQLQNGDVQRQRSCDDGTVRRRHRSGSKKLVGGSGSTGSGSYLAISN